MRFTFALAVLAIATFSSSATGQDAWPGRMGDLIAGGLVIGGQDVKLNAPKFDPRSPSEERSAAQERLAGAHGWKRFSRNSVVAPVKIELAYLKNESDQRIGHRVHVAYVVHAGLDTLRDADLMGDLFGKPSDGDSDHDDETARESSEGEESFLSEELDPKELAALQIEPEEGVSYGWLEFLLLKKVDLQGVIRSQRWEEENFVAISWELDDRFSDQNPAHETYRNEWIRRDRGPNGELMLSDPKPYSGVAGYLVISTIAGLGNASLIEAEVVLHEPEGWFNGSSLLRSKLPLILQESARRFRRGLKGD